MPRYKDYEYKPKRELTSEFNMGADFLRFLCNEVMSEVALRGVMARDNPRFRTVEQYYSIVRELFNQSESVWSKEESDEVFAMLKEIEKKIDFIGRKLNGDSMVVINEIELVQRIIYNTIRKYNMLIPVAVDTNTREEKLRLLRTAFGLHGSSRKKDDWIEKDDIDG